MTQSDVERLLIELWNTRKPVDSVRNIIAHMTPEAKELFDEMVGKEAEKYMASFDDLPGSSTFTIMLDRDWFLPRILEVNSFGKSLCGQGNTKFKIAVDRPWAKKGDVYYIGVMDGVLIGKIKVEKTFKGGTINNWLMVSWVNYNWELLPIPEKLIGGYIKKIENE